MKAIEILKHKWIQGNVVYDNDTQKHTRYLKYDDELMHEAIKELELLDNDLKDLFCCIELEEDENAEKRLSSMETYLIRLSKYIK